MKRLSIVLLAVCLICSASPVLAASGSAIVPMIRFQVTSNVDVAPWLFIDNITANAITVTITYYEKDGTVVTDGTTNASAGTIRGVNVTGYDEQVTGASVSFDIAANEQGIAYLVGGTSDKAGWARVEWSQSSEAIVGLAAHQVIYTVNTSDGSTAQHSVPVNAGLPF